MHPRPPVRRVEVEVGWQWSSKECNLSHTWLLTLLTPPDKHLFQLRLLTQILRKIWIIIFIPFDPIHFPARPTDKMIHDIWICLLCTVLYFIFDRDTGLENVANSPSLLNTSKNRLKIRRIQCSREIRKNTYSFQSISPKKIKFRLKFVRNTRADQILLYKIVFTLQ